MQTKSEISKYQLLEKIKKGLVQKTSIPFPSLATHPIFDQSVAHLQALFAERFTAAAGELMVCSNRSSVAETLIKLSNSNGLNNLYCVEQALIEKFQLTSTTQLHFNQTNLEQCDAAITSCEGLIARTGSLLLSSETPSGRTASVYAPVHICIAYRAQLVYDIADGLSAIQKKYERSGLPSSITLATGPSRTADIEKTLVVGVHGPKQVFLILIDE